jgi:hypothetical protein
MFLSDAVKNELSGMYHAKFSNQLETTPEAVETPVAETPVEVKTEIKTETQTNPIDNQSAERRFINDKQTDNMTEQNPGKTSADKQTVDTLVKELESTALPVAQEPAKEQAKVEVIAPVEPKVEQKQETIATKELNSIVPQNPMDDKMLDALADRLVSKLKDSTPKPVTVNEFGSDIVDPQTETVNRLAESLAKM